MNLRYPLVAQRAARHCEYCAAPEAVFNFPFEVEHIVPFGRGGADIESNWALACRSCNVHKSVHTEGIDPESQSTVKLFHPRLDRWTEHFQLDLSSGRIIGLTPTGRATVARLQMNSAVQIAARHQWMRLQLFPPI